MCAADPSTPVPSDRLRLVCRLPHPAEHGQPDASVLGLARRLLTDPCSANACANLSWKKTQDEQRKLREEQEARRARTTHQASQAYYKFQRFHSTRHDNVELRNTPPPWGGALSNSALFLVPCAMRPNCRELGEA